METQTQQRLSEETRALVRALINDYDALNQQEAATAALKIIKDHFYWYCEYNLRIKDKTGQMIPLKPNWAQKILVDYVLECIAEGVPARAIILKARQMGLSTIIEALCYWWTATHRYITSVIIAHEKPAANNLYKMFRRYYEGSDRVFQPIRKYNTKTDLTFDISDEDKARMQSEGLVSPGLQSEIKTMVARDGGGRSDTINFFHGSEVAFWDAGADVLSSALQAIPMLPNTFAFLESTANGIGGYFFDEWQFAKKGESAFKAFFFAWHEHPEYMIRDFPVGTLDAEEQELIEIFKDKGYPEEDWIPKLAWRRQKKKEFHADPDKFYQEYPKDDMEAFLASGRPVFDMRKLMEMETRANLAKDAVRFANIVEVGRKMTLQFVPRIHQNQDPTSFKIWDEPKIGERYVIGADVAEGIERSTSGDRSQGDYSVIDVMNSSGKTVARWRGHIDPDLLGDLLFQIGTLYNFALIGCEVNNHGLTTIQRLRDKLYRNLYMRETQEDNQFQERTAKMGWRTDIKTKPIMINELQRAIREGDILDLDVVFIRECMTYVRDDNGRTNAQEGQFDDCVIAKAIGLQMLGWNNYNIDDLQSKIKKPITRNGKNATNNDFPTAFDTTGLRRPKRQRDGLIRRDKGRRAVRRQG